MKIENNVDGVEKPIGILGADGLTLTFSRQEVWHHSVLVKGTTENGGKDTWIRTGLSEAPSDGGDTPPVVTSVSPYLVTPHGGTRITIMGSGFGDTPEVVSVLVGRDFRLCSDVKLMSASKLTCKSPPGMGHQVRLVVVVESRESSEVFAINYMSALVHSLVNPVFNGWATAGSTVLVSGDYFTSNGLLRCRLNVVTNDGPSKTASVAQAAQLATYIDEHTLSCPLPRVPASVRGEVEVSNDGGIRWGGSTSIQTRKMLFPSGGSEPLGDEVIVSRAPPSELIIAVAIDNTMGQNGNYFVAAAAKAVGMLHGEEGFERVLPPGVNVTVKFVDFKQCTSSNDLAALRALIDSSQGSRLIGVVGGTCSSTTITMQRELGKK